MYQMSLLFVIMGLILVDMVITIFTYKSNQREMNDICTKLRKISIDHELLKAKVDVMTRKSKPITRKKKKDAKES